MAKCNQSTSMPFKGLIIVIIIIHVHSVLLYAVGNLL